MTFNQIQAATVIQQNLRHYWQKSGRVFPSQRLDATTAVVKQSLEQFGIGPLCFNSQPLLPMGKQAIIGILKADSLVETLGVARIPHEKEDSDFSEELAVRELLSTMGLTGAIYRGKNVNVTVDFDAFFSTIWRRWNFSGYSKKDPLYRLFQCKTLQESIALAKTFTKEERDECQLIHGDPALRLNMHYVTKVIQLVFKMADLNVQKKTLKIPLLIFTGPETSGHRIMDVAKIPVGRRVKFAQLLGEIVEPGHMGGSTFPRFIFTMAQEERAEFCSLITTYSFEQLMAVAYLLGIPDLSHEQLSCYNTPHGKIHLFLYSSELKIYPNDSVDENWLTTLPHMDQPVTNNFRTQVKGWKDRLLGDLTGLPFDNIKLGLLKSRMIKLAAKLDAKEFLTWRELMLDLRADWVENASVAEELRQGFLSASCTISTAEETPNEGYVDLLHWKPPSRRIQWNKYYQRVKEVEAVVAKIMPRVTQIIDEVQRSLYPVDKMAFFKAEDRGDPKKFIGYLCCGITTLTTMIFMRAHGIHSIKSGSTRFDHSFLRIPTEYNVDIFVDPTYKQMFSRPLAMQERYWHQLPPAIVGAPKDIRAFYTKHKRLQGPFKGHSWIYPVVKDIPARTSESNVDSLHREILGSRTENVHFLRGPIKHRLTPKELASLERSCPQPVSDIIEVSAPALPPARAIELIQPYVRRVLYFGIKDDLRPIGERPLSNLIPEGYKIDDIFTLYGVLLKRLGFKVNWFIVEKRKFLELQDADQRRFYLSCHKKGEKYDLTDFYVAPLEMLEENVRSALMEYGHTVPNDWKLPEICSFSDEGILDVENALTNPMLYKELFPQSMKQIVKGIANEGQFRTSQDD